MPTSCRKAATAASRTFAGSLPTSATRADRALAATEACVARTRVERIEAQSGDRLARRGGLADRPPGIGDEGERSDRTEQFREPVVPAEGAGAPTRPHRPDDLLGGVQFVLFAEAAQRRRGFRRAGSGGFRRGYRRLQFAPRFGEKRPRLRLRDRERLAGRADVAAGRVGPARGPTVRRRCEREVAG